MHWNGLEELKASQAYQRAMSGTADTGRTQSSWRGRGGHDNRGGRRCIGRHRRQHSSAEQ